MSIVQDTQNNQWISVEDKYPNCYERVLCHRPGKFSVIGKAILGTNFCDFIGEDGRLLLEVTHWQPLPEPPPLNKPL